MDTFKSLKSRSLLKRVTKVYEGSADDLANLAVVLHFSLKNWVKRHPDYTYTLETNNEQLHLHIIKNE